MSYDEQLAQRVRHVLCRQPKRTERKMFGGLCFLLNGNMCGGVLKDELIVRVRPEEYDAAMKRPHTRVLDFTGRPLKGFVVVLPKGYATDKALKYWVKMGIRCARSRPTQAVKHKPRVKRHTRSSRIRR